MEWIQNKSIAHYATYDVRRVTSPVLPAFINLQAYFFWKGSDSVFNLLQYLSYVTNSVLIYNICKKMELEKKFCYLGVILFLSMPIAYGEALSTQVDQFSALWLLIFVYLLIDFLRKDFQIKRNKKTVFDVVLLSCCIAYGYLAKPSIMFEILFFSCWLLIVCVQRKDNIKDLVLLGMMALGIVTVIISPEVIRNIVTFGSISDPIAGKRQLIGTLHPTYVIVDGLMNYVMNLPNNFIHWEDIIEHGVYWIAYIFNVNINSPLIAEDGVTFYLHDAGQYNHDMAVNPVIVMGGTFAFISFLVKRIKKETMDRSWYYVACSFISFLFFCCVVRWEPYVTRYMLSYLALLCPAVAIWISKIRKKEWKNAVNSILVFISICELFNLSEYHLNICLDQNAQAEKMVGYFTVNSSGADNYLKLEKELQKVDNCSIGIYASMASTYEYPIWTMINTNVHMESILTDNKTIKYENRDFIPEYIIVINKNADDIANYKMQRYYCYKYIDHDFTIWKLEK